MQLSDFHYDLPEELIAQQPSERRGDSRLLHLPAGGDGVADRHFSEFADLLRPGDLLWMPDHFLYPMKEGHCFDVFRVF